MTATTAADVTSRAIAARAVAAARDLAAESGAPSFTVQQVVERAGMSLKAFYREFSGKDDLLVALFEEDSRRGAEVLAAMVDRHADPLARLHASVVGLFRIVASTDQRAYMVVVTREHLRLAEHRPHALRAVLAPLLEILVAEFRRAAAAGVVRADDPVRDAVTVFHLLRGHLEGLVLGHVDGEPEAVGEHLWDFSLRALRP